MATTEVTAADNWVYEFKGMPKYIVGTKNEVQYTVEEIPVEEYEVSVDGYDLTNSYTPEVFDIHGIKIWDDAENQDGNRPNSITVNLLANGKHIDSIKVTASDNWEYSFLDLPVYEAGKKSIIQ